MTEASRLDVGLGARGSIRWAAADLTDVVREAQLRLDLGPLAAIAFGRLAAGASLLLRLSSKVPRRLTVDVRGEGPLGRVLAEADSEGNLRGLVTKPHAVGAESETDLSVGAGFGSGILSVRRDGAEGGGYEGKVKLVSGGIGSDIAHYLEQSEQRQAAVLLGVYVTPNGIAAAGGVILEALPGADLEAIARLESNLARIHSFSKELDDQGLDAMVDRVLEGLGSERLESSRLRYNCQCQRSSLATQLATMPSSQIQELVDDDGYLRAECAFCGVVYRFTADELAQSN